MAPEPYVRKNPGDIIRSGDWNELQSMARTEIQSHQHKGSEDGKLIPRDGIQPAAIDGSRIDPAAEVTVKTLTATGNLTVAGKDVLADVANLVATVKGLQGDKVSRAGDTVVGPLTVQKGLTVLGGLKAAAGSVAIGDGGLAVGDWSQPAKGNLSVTGVITASSSASPPPRDQFGLPTSVSGIRFRDNPGGGGADTAYIHYYARSGEACTLEIGVWNDADDHIALMATGGVGIGVLDPKAKLTVKGDFIRQVRMATGLGPEDAQDNGPIVSRTLTFTKLYADTAIRIFYCDNLRVAGPDASARWEIRIDGNSVPGGGIYQDKYGNTGNYHEPATILGYAMGIPAGQHTIGIWVGRVPDMAGAVDAHTGWHNSRWTIEAQEVWV